MDTSMAYVFVVKSATNIATLIDFIRDMCLPYTVYIDQQVSIIIRNRPDCSLVLNFMMDHNIPFSFHFREQYMQWSIPPYIDVNPSTGDNYVLH